MVNKDKNIYGDLPQRFSKPKLSKSSKKVLSTFAILSIYLIGKDILLPGVDQIALKKAFLELKGTNSTLVQAISMYSGSLGGEKFTFSPLSLGIIPYINASIFIDLLSTLFPEIEKIQAEEIGRRQIAQAKKVLTIVLAAFQGYFLLSILKPYLYTSNFLGLLVLLVELISGSLIVISLSNKIDKRGIGNGTSLLIALNILLGFQNKNFWTSFKPLDGFVLLALISVICYSQKARVNLPIVSARQLSLLEIGNKKREFNFFNLRNSGLSIRYTQAGIFPIIIASNLLPIFSYFFNTTKTLQILTSICYYIAIIIFNYIYTTVFWDPEKISEQLRKSSVSIVNVTPGEQTVTYLRNVAFRTSIGGGIFLSFLLFFYDFSKGLLGSVFLSQVNVSSIIILVGVFVETEKALRSMFINDTVLET